MMDGNGVVERTVKLFIPECVPREELNLPIFVGAIISPGLKQGSAEIEMQEYSLLEQVYGDRLCFLCFFNRTIHCAVRSSGTLFDDFDELADDLKEKISRICEIPQGPETFKRVELGYYGACESVLGVITRGSSRADVEQCIRNAFGYASATATSAA